MKFTFAVVATVFVLGLSAVRAEDAATPASTGTPVNTIEAESTKIQNETTEKHASKKAEHKAKKEAHAKSHKARHEAK